MGPVWMAIIGFIFMALLAAIYNLLARWLGGIVLATMLLPLSAAEPVVITEVMAWNVSHLEDPDGGFDDWIEIHNASDDPLDIAGLFLTDDPEDPGKFQISATDAAATTISPRGYLLLWADGDTGRGPLHLPFAINSAGETISIYDRDGQTLVDQIVLPPQHPDTSYGRRSLKSEEAIYFVHPSPREPNIPLGVSVLNGIEFSRLAGVFREPFDLTLSTETSEAVIRYTIDESAPNSGSELYEAPIRISQAGCVRAALYLENTRIAPVESRVYLAVDEELAAFSSNLPVVLIESDGYRFSRDRTLSRDFPPQPVCAVFVDTGDDGRASPTGSVDFSGRAGMNVRGASSREWPKKQYKFETWGEDDLDRDVSLLGLPADADWVLYAPYFDKTLMRNYLVYLWWEQLGYHPVRTRFMEVFINMDGDGVISMEDYVGVYLLVEKIKRAPDRVDVAPLQPTDLEEPEITGGYVLQTTNIDEHFYSRRGVKFKFVDPKRQEREFSKQRAWIRNHINDFESVLFGRDYKDPEEGFRKFIDLPSHIDYDIFREFTRNIDGASTFMSLERGGKLEMGPLWDYNQSLGMTSLWRGWETNGWNEAYMQAGHWAKWWQRMDGDDEYQQAWIDRWVELRDGYLSTQKLLGDVDATAEHLQESQARNFERWKLLGRVAWSGREAPGWRDRDTFDKEVAWMHNWLDERLRWIDAHVPAPPKLSLDTGPIEAGAKLKIVEDPQYEPLDGTIYVTMDGMDPRLTGGGINPQAIPYAEPIPLHSTTTIAVRTRGETRRGVARWGALREATFIVGLAPAGASSLTLTEIHYNPRGSDAHEFLEFTNRGDTAIDLGGVSVSGAVRFNFEALTLLPGKSIMIVEDARAFAKRYQKEVSPWFHEGIEVAGQWEGALANGGEEIVLNDQSKQLILRVSYDDDPPWPENADGRGRTLELVGLDVAVDKSSSWRESMSLHGSPGRFADAIVEIRIASASLVDDRAVLVIAGPEELPETYGIESSSDLTAWEWEVFRVLRTDPDSRTSTIQLDKPIDLPNRAGRAVFYRLRRK